MRQLLLVMLGYPGSGKSYFAKQLAQELHAVRLNGDGIRHNMFSDEKQRWDSRNNPIVFGALDYATQEILQAGYSVIYDASHNRRSDRRKAVVLAQPFGMTPIIIWIKTPLTTAKEREAARTLTADQVHLRTARYDELVASLQPPTSDEVSIHIDGLLSFKEQLLSFNNQLSHVGV